MKKYLIKKHCEANELLTISTGRTQDYYYGSNPDGRYLSRDHLPTDPLIKAYGFDSTEDAKAEFVSRCNSAEFERKHGQWQITVEIVEVNV